MNFNCISTQIFCTFKQEWMFIMSVQTDWAPIECYKPWTNAILWAIFVCVWQNQIGTAASRTNSCYYIQSWIITLKVKFKLYCNIFNGLDNSFNWSDSAANTQNNQGYKVYLLPTRRDSFIKIVNLTLLT